MDTYRRTFLIYNPFAGGLQRRRHALRRSIELLMAKGLDVEAIPTPGPKAAAEIVRSIADRGADLIVAAGGDGTINEVVNGMVGSDIPLGILPAGTANVLATEMGIAKSMERAAESLLHSTPVKVALGRVCWETEECERYFLMMAGAGLDADIVYNLNLRMKRALGKVAYWMAGFAKFGHGLEEFTVAIDGREYRASFALVSRVRNYGGDLEIAPTISLFEDEFEVVLFEGKSSMPYTKYMLGALAHKLDGMQGVTILRARQVTFLTAGVEPVRAQVDGEYAGVLPARVEIVPNALTLLVPADFLAKRQASVEDAAWTTSPTR